MSGEEQRLFDEKEVAEQLNLSRKTLSRLRKAGKIAFYRTARRIRYASHHITRYLESCERKAER